MKEPSGKIEIDGLNYKKNEIEIKKRIDEDDGVFYHNGI